MSTQTQHAPALAATARYLVIPDCPRDVWYGIPAAVESYQLVCFVEQRHKFINPAFDAQYLADALNEKARNEQTVRLLEAAMKYVPHGAIFGDWREKSLDEVRLQTQIRAHLAALQQEGAAK